MYPLLFWVAQNALHLSQVLIKLNSLLLSSGEVSTDMET